MNGHRRRARATSFSPSLSDTMRRLLTCMLGPIIDRSCIPARVHNHLCAITTIPGIGAQNKRARRRRRVHELRRSTLIRMATMAAGRPAGGARGGTGVDRAPDAGGRGINGRAREVARSGPGGVAKSSYAFCPDATVHWTLRVSLSPASQLVGAARDHIRSVMLGRPRGARLVRWTD